MPGTIKGLIARLLPYAAALGLLLFFAVYAEVDQDVAEPEDEVFCFQGACPDEEETLGQASAQPLSEPAGPVQPQVFIDVTARAGVDFQHQNRQERLEYGGGVAVFDFNNDGFDDIYAVNSLGPNALYRNNGDGTFTDVAAAAGVDDPEGYGNGSCAADYDNDGDTDLFVTNYGPSRLFRNEGSGTFVDVTLAAGADDSLGTYRNTGCAWGDYDSDGLLDLIVLRHYHEGVPNIFTLRRWYIAVRRLALLHNSGDGTFTNVTYLLGDVSGPDFGNPPLDEPGEPSPGSDFEEDPTPGPITGAFVGNIWGAGFQPSWVDFDNDGDLDLYVVNDTGWEIQPNVLWRNDGLGPGGEWSFVDVSEPTGADVDVEGMGLAVGDWNLDGDLDLFVTNIGDNVLLNNQMASKEFTDDAVRSGAAVGKVGRNPRVAWGTVSIDYDNDADEDLYIVSGWIKGTHRLDRDTTQPNVLLRNSGDGTFVDASFGSGAEDRGKGRGGVYLDYDKDGCLDLFITNYGETARLLRNLCESENNWLVINTVGTTSNRDGVGARITVVAGGATQIRETASGSGYMSQNSKEAHFGLGPAELAESITVKWPSGRVQTLHEVTVNQHLTVTEPE